MVKRLNPGRQVDERFPFNATLTCEQCGETFQLEPGDEWWYVSIDDARLAATIGTRCPNPTCGEELTAEGSGPLAPRPAPRVERERSPIVPYDASQHMRGDRYVPLEERIQIDPAWTNVPGVSERR